MTMDIESRLSLVREVGEEIITEGELRQLLETKKNPVAYDGFEPSGILHIAQGILRVINVNRMTQAGVKFKMYAADWHGWANNKLGGDLEKINKCGDYLVEAWKAAGMETKNVEFVRASDVVSKSGYWKKVLQISRHSTIQRIIRTGQIMGRKDAEVQQASQIIYPCMQAADIFELEADICQLGMDQRKVNILAREMGPKLGWWKPVIVSHHMLLGLQHVPSTATDAVERSIDLKMSKSKPDSAIFMTDTAEEIKCKIAKAYCPMAEEENPILEYCRYIIFPSFKKVKIVRKFGGDLEFSSYGDLAAAFKSGDIHPADLKASTASYVDKLVNPVRKHFSKGNARTLAEEVKSFAVTR